VIDEREVTGRLDDQLAESLARLVSDAGSRATMSEAIHALARPRAAAHVASLVWSLVTSQRPKRAPAAV